MALGGGTFTVQNKVLPGAYVNVVSVAKATANLSDRGFATMAFELDWGADDTVFEVTNGDFQKNSLALFGYDYTHEKLKGLRDLFLNLSTLYAYRLNSGEKASCTYGEAKYSGVRGNDLKVVIGTNVDDNALFDVSLYIDDVLELDSQTVASASELLDNDFIIWDKDATLAVTAGLPLTNGSNGVVTGLSHQNYLDKIESYSYNVMGVVTTDDTIKQLYSSFTKRMRDEVGAKFQLVAHNHLADYEGVISVKNDVTNGYSVADLVYWVVGAEAGCAVNKSTLNKKYKGEFDVVCDYTQSQLTKCILDGEYTFHKVYDDVCVLSDINTLVTTSDTKGDVFKENQTIRVTDQIANDIATLFSRKYLGVVPNDKAGRDSLWADIVKHHEQLQSIRAIENFKGTDIVITQGDTKRDVVVSDYVTVVNAMAKLYMTVQVG